MKKYFIALIAVILVGFGYGAYQYFSQQYGSTVGSREKMLNGTPEGTEWNISQEQQFGDYLLCSIYSDTKSGIAAFEEIGNGKYKLNSR